MDTNTHTYRVMFTEGMENEVTFKWVSINKSAGPFNILCPVSAQCLFHLSAGALTEGVLALLQINIGLNI